MAHEVNIPPGVEIAFESILPVSDEVCLGQIGVSLGRDLREALQRKYITIVANGPSARGYFHRLAGWHHNLPDFTPTLALNGALRLFLENGESPNYWAACDPQELVADFLPDDPPEDITYLVASKCHPRVFDKLRGRDVRLWHVSDHPAAGRSRVPTCESVTMSAAWLMHRLGYTDMQFWGWDCCFGLKGEHHAGDAETWIEPEEPVHINYGGIIRKPNGEAWDQALDGPTAGIWVDGGDVFATTRTWAAEANAAQQFFQLMEYFDVAVTIHGGGMIGHARQAALAALGEAR